MAGDRQPRRYHSSDLSPHFFGHIIELTEIITQTEAPPKTKKRKDFCGDTKHTDPDGRKASGRGLIMAGASGRRVVSRPNQVQSPYETMQEEVQIARGSGSGPGVARRDDAGNGRI